MIKNPMTRAFVKFLEAWKLEKEQEGLIPTVELLLEELNQDENKH